ncbi:hypothetical protein [Kaistia terrae]|uniref:Uncharacterized protein n=1 Tax=Kaistia terrae TaxID=537017 RepID=A0ABW0Q0G2_9HYPH|nr:hypothetical protein [Kaistia terrae]MCX5578945.1 hypothetical protein [Kaistia terrae]
MGKIDVLVGDGIHKLDAKLSDLAKRDLRGPETTIRRSMIEHDIPESAFREYGSGWLAVFISVLEQELEWFKARPVQAPSPEILSREGLSAAIVPAV